MKLLLDQNLSPRLVRRLAELYPNSSHLDFKKCAYVAIEISSETSGGKIPRPQLYRNSQVICNKAVDIVATYGTVLK